MPGKAVVAIASARGAAARAVIRVAGDDVARLLAERFEPLGNEAWNPRARAARRGWWTLPARGWRFPVDVWNYSAPRSATGTDLAEILVPGAPALTRAFLEDLVRLGATLAAPGAYTRMAVLNGRLDLAQADAVLALIRARDDAEARAAHLALEGGDSRRLESFEDALVDLLVPLESALDFSDQDFLAVVPSDLAVRAAALAAAFDKAAEGTAPTRSDDLPRVVLVGRANAGKSTLWNALTGGVALTGDIPGTTRDPLAREGACAGVRVVWIDTAGIDGPRGPVDDVAHALRERHARGADLRVGVADARAPVFPEFCDLKVATHLDLEGRIPEGVLGVSVPAGLGLDALKTAVAEILASRASGVPTAFPLRIAEGLREAALLLRRGVEALAVHPPEFAASDWREAQRVLRGLRRAGPGDPVLDRIFSSWCIGK